MASPSPTVGSSVALRLTDAESGRTLTVHVGTMIYSDPGAVGWARVLTRIGGTATMFRIGRHGRAMRNKREIAL